MLYIALVLLAGISLSAVPASFFSEWYDRMVVGGLTGLAVGIVLLSYGHHYVVSPDNPFAITGNDIAIGGVLTIVAGCIAAWGFPLFTPPPRTKSKEDTAYVPLLPY